MGRAASAGDGRSEAGDVEVNAALTIRPSSTLRRSCNRAWRPRNAVSLQLPSTDFRGAAHLGRVASSTASSSMFRIMEVRGRLVAKGSAAAAAERRRRAGRFRRRARQTESSIGQDARESSCFVFFFFCFLFGLFFFFFFFFSFFFFYFFFVVFGRLRVVRSSGQQRGGARALAEHSRVRGRHVAGACARRWGRPRRSTRRAPRRLLLELRTSRAGRAQLAECSRCTSSAVSPSFAPRRGIGPASWKGPCAGELSCCDSTQMLIFPGSRWRNALMPPPSRRRCRCRGEPSAAGA